MKNKICATLGLLTLLTRASASAQSRSAEFNIPFEFHVGDTVLPAGRYHIGSENSPGVLLVRCFDSKKAAMITTIAVEAGKRLEKRTLLFNRYDNAYFLSGVWMTGYPQGREVPKSRIERELARRALPQAPADILVAVK